MAATAAVVLAAGKGTRFKSDLAKVLHRVGGRSLLHHVLASLEPVGFDQTIVVIGHQAGDVRAEVDAIGAAVDLVVQEEQLGTGHAAEVALAALRADIERVVVLPGDSPLLLPSTLEALLADPADVVMLMTELDDPSGYVRVVRRGDTVARIVEHKDASHDELAIREVNAGMYRFPVDGLADVLASIGTENVQGERYLTDAIAVFLDRGASVTALTAPSEEVAGVNDRAQLAAAGAVLRQRILRRHLVDGVTIVDPTTTWIEADVTIGSDATILPNTHLEGATAVAEGASVGPNCRLVDTTVGAEATVTWTVTDGAEIGARATVGPFTYLRPGTRLAAGAKAGGFVEMKNATVGEGSKVPHLSYIGDATIGRDVNVGAGTITCNYDGFDKHETIIGDGAFIGSDTMLVAPVEIGPGAVTGAGSAIAEDVPADALGIERTSQENVEGWAARRRAKHGEDSDS
ncbi:MAG: bifunctional UDP-N-acetylglucosamine diphosphorylase/glucosamine-1-phosphate N-acetyltransferase GlmU [Nitriliruptorales bacterium]|nr:bifunctional UDP-N-acetylglucosamine diphosphorylase/glucosamine-1-phosphate N-acetyltransferase GlmU [Nitriliruptorales bacterium]